jgi:hypothetical protein
MEKLTGINTEIGIIKGRDAIYLDKILFSKETELTLTGEFSYDKWDKKFEMTFKGIVFLSTIELDFDKRGQNESLAVVEDSETIKEFKKLDHSSKINDRYKHYYIRTYDTVFEIISDRFELTIET